METVGFFANKVPHLSCLNVKLQGVKHTLSDLITTIRPFQNKWDILKHDIRSKLIWGKGRRKIPDILSLLRSWLLTLQQTVAVSSKPFLHDRHYWNSQPK